MTPASLNNSPTTQHHPLIAALRLLFSRATRFYLYQAETAGPANLRRQFAALAELHQQIVDVLPSSSTSVPPEVQALSDLSRWYSHTPDSRSVQNIQQGLTKQLQLQKTLIRSSSLHQHRIILLHFTASLQIAADQLAQSH